MHVCVSDAKPKQDNSACLLFHRRPQVRENIKAPVLGSLSNPLSATNMTNSLIPHSLLKNYYFPINEIQLKRRDLITEPLQ